jgi:hypothetical protein
LEKYINRKIHFYSEVVLLSERLRNYRFWIAILLVIVTGILMYTVYIRLYPLHFEVGGELLHHWFSWGGVLFVATFIPVYHLLKRAYPKRYKSLLNVHIFGNLVAVMFVSIHFTQQVTRPPVAYPDLGTGIVLYPTMLLLVVAGFVMAFGFAKTRYRAWWFFHTSLAVTFYMVIAIHILHGLEII